MSRSFSYGRCAALAALAGAVLFGPAAGVAHSARADFAAPHAAARVVPRTARAATLRPRAPRTPQQTPAPRPGRREERAGLQKAIWGPRASNERQTAGLNKALWGPRHR